MYAGFLIIAAIYLLVGIMVWKGRKRFLRIPIMNRMIWQLFQNDEQDEED